MIEIVDYNAGNPTSVQRALAAVGVQSHITPDPDTVARAERIIFPGVGHASSTMAVLRARGLDEALTTAFRRGVPLLGVCVGAQLLLDRSEEGDTPCLGLVKGVVRRFPTLPSGLKVPHMGWNAVRSVRAHPLMPQGEDAQGSAAAAPQFYFVHSYYLQPEDPGLAVGRTEHGIEFISAFATRNLFAAQFHPEKSGPLGLELLRRFALWHPEKNLGDLTC